jgi:WhiB family transcriptional regulator, redox-sensing transcriptional regulator
VHRPEELPGSSFSRSHLSLITDAEAFYAPVSYTATDYSAAGYDDVSAFDTLAPAEELPLAGWGDTDAGEEPWRLDALCAETDPEAFFPEKGGSTREAKRVCTGCTVRAECLEFALANDERFGIWGGLSERERRRLRLQRRELTA